MEENRLYCTKVASRQGGPWEAGELLDERKAPESKRVEAIAAMREYVAGGGSLKRARVDERFINLFYANNALTTTIFNDMVREHHAPHGLLELRSWQKTLKANLEMPADDRSVWWFFDKQGGSGKSSFAVHMASVLGDACFISDGAGQLGDLKMSWQKASQAGAVDVVFIDMSRCQEQQTGAIYRFIETVKNKWCSNTKYQSEIFYTKQAHVVCFANNPPKVENLSMDRWKIFELMPVASGRDWVVHKRSPQEYIEVVELL